MQHTIVHELGHSLDYLLNLRTNKDILAIFKSMSKTDMAKNLSGYGSTKIEEFIAEVFADYHLSNKPKEITIETMKIIDEIYKKRFL